MINTHIVLVSGQPIPNMIPAISRPPQKIHLLVSDRMERQAARLSLYFNSHGIECIKHLMDAYDMGQVESVCLKLLEGAAPGSVMLNATGGTKVAAFGAFAAFRDRGFPIVYFDPEKWKISYLDGSNLPSETAVAELSVCDYLSVHGLNVIDDAGNDDVVRKRRELTKWLAKELPQSGLFIRILNTLATEAQRTSSFPAQKTITRFDPSFSRFLKKLDSENMILWDSKSCSLTFPDVDSARYLGGFWLEEYVHDVVLGLSVHDVRRNVRVAWEGSGIKPVTNEFDVVFTDKCRLYMISCKASKLSVESHYKDKNPVYELDSLKDDAAGLFGQGILVSATPLGIELQKRANALKLITLSGRELPWLGQKLQSALHLR